MSIEQSKIDDNLHLLQTIYDTVEIVSENVIITTDKSKNIRLFGVATLDDSIYLDACHSELIYTENYILAVNINTGCGKAIINSSDGLIEYTVDNTGGKYEKWFEEHSGLDFKLLEIKSENNIFKVINTITGEILGEINKADKDSYRCRPYNNWIVLSFIDHKTNELMGITQEFKVYRLDEALRIKYANIEIKRRSRNSKPRYTAIDKETGEYVILNRFGQLY